MSKIKITDLGNYIKINDVGLHIKQIKGGLVIGPIGILQWGLAQFGTIGILGYTPTTISNSQQLNIRQP